MAYGGLGSLQLFFGLFGAAIGAVYGTPVGLILGLVMAFWFRMAEPVRRTVRLTITILSMVVAWLVLVAFGFQDDWGDSSLSLFVPIVGLITWFGLLVVLKPSRTAREDPPSPRKVPPVAWDWNVDSDQ